MKRKTRKKSNEKFTQEVYELVGEEYVFLEGYIDGNTKILCRHNKCRYEWTIRPRSFLSGQKCPQCTIIDRAKQQIKTDSQFKQEIYNLAGTEYEFLDEYKNSKAKIKCRHNTCGYEWETRPNQFLRGSRCPKCAGLIKKTTETFKDDVYNLVGSEYEVLGEYINTRTKIKMKHNKCRFKYLMTPNGVLNGYGCPQCSESKGEQLVREYINSANLRFKQEYTFDDLLGVNDGLLRFDFAVFDNDDNLKFLIEYDGIFHFEKLYKNDSFETTQIHDERKNQYCKDNNIPLLRIPYWEFNNIEQILDKWIKDYDITKS